MSVPTSTWRSVSKRLLITPGCWEWQGARNRRGYGYVVVEYLGGGRTRSDYVHRVLYRELVGPIPEGLQLDHLCKNTSCANPDHLEPVTSRENTLRGGSFAAKNAGKASCPSGHPYAGDNLIAYRGRRYCRACKRAHVKRSQERKQTAAA